MVRSRDSAGWNYRQSRLALQTRASEPIFAEGDMKTLADKISAWMNLATARQSAIGVSWYPAAREFCIRVAERTGIPYNAVCGVVAALSPAVVWKINKQQAENLCEAYAAGEGIDDVALSTYSQQQMKAHGILQRRLVKPSEIRKVLGPTANKTKAFFDNLLSAGSRDVTVDRHIIAALQCEHYHLERRKPYMRICYAFRNVADRMHMHPYEVQAVVWVTYKEVAGAFSQSEGDKRVDDLPV